MNSISDIQVFISKVFNFSLLNTENISIQLGDVFFLVFLILITKLFLRLTKKIVFRSQKITQLSKSHSFTIFKITKYFIITISVVIGMQSLGLNLNFLLASSAALFVGIGLGIQDVFKDVISGIILLFGKTIIVGDVIEVDDIVGRVTDIGFRVSTIRTRQDIDMVVPNSKFINDNVVNWSLNNQITRFQLNIGVAYGSDVQLVKKVLLKAAVTNKEVSKIKSPFVRFADFGNSSLDFQLFFWSENIFRIENILSDLRFEIEAQFRKNNITIPFPQTDVHIYKQEN
ncbi:MAG: mechanosensitive ion channel [Bacteroidota bacterium]|nr:mechanosensitive ion channel [Bacteroidota bacterium]